jgi:hypothetical protein
MTDHWESGVTDHGPCRVFHSTCGGVCAVLYRAPLAHSIPHAVDVMEPRGVRDGDAIVCCACNEPVMTNEFKPERFRA